MFERLNDAVEALARGGGDTVTEVARNEQGVRPGKPSGI